MTKRFDVCGLGNAVVDIFLICGYRIPATGFDRGTMVLVDKGTQQQLLTRFHDGDHDLVLVSGAR